MFKHGQRAAEAFPSDPSAWEHKLSSCWACKCLSKKVLYQQGVFYFLTPRYCFGSVTIGTDYHQHLPEETTCFHCMVQWIISLLRMWCSKREEEVLTHSVSAQASGTLRNFRGSVQTVSSDHWESANPDGLKLKGDHFQLSFHPLYALVLWWPLPAPSTIERETEITPATSVSGYTAKALPQSPCRDWMANQSSEEVCVRMPVSYHSN